METSANTNNELLPLSTSSSTLGHIPELPKEGMALEQGSNVASPPDVEKGTDSELPVPTVPIAQYEHDLVEFDGPDDPANPQNWSKAKKWRITGSMGGMTFVVTFASSIFVSILWDCRLRTDVD
jgi:hypothetical protein